MNRYVHFLQDFRNSYIVIIGELYFFHSCSFFLSIIGKKRNQISIMFSFKIDEFEKFELIETRRDESNKESNYVRATILYRIHSIVKL